MKEGALADGLLSKSDYIEIMILAHCCIEVELAFNVLYVHHLVVILVPNFFFDQVVALVFLSIRANFSCILCLYSREVENFLLLFLSLGIATDLSPTGLLGLVARRKTSWGEVLSVEDPDFSLVD